MNTKKAKKTNKIIPPLLSLFNEYNYNLRTRLKANSFFLSFDEKSKKTFNKFIILSNERFKLMKYGGNLNQILTKQKMNYNKINNDIKKDILFTSNYPNIERQKLVKSVNIIKSKEISNMREKLYETLRYNSPYDKKIKLEKELKIINEKENEKKRLNDIENNKEIIKINANDAIEEDQQKFNKGLEQYKYLLKEKENELNDSEEKKVIKIYKNDFSDIESHIKEKNIKILTYKSKSTDNKQKKKIEDAKFDINILYKIKNYNNKTKDLNFFPKIKSIDIDINKNLNRENNNARKSHSNFKLDTFNNIDMKNTIGLINKEAENINLNDKFKIKKNRFIKKYNKTLFGNYNFNIYQKSKYSNQNLKQHLKDEKNLTNPKILKKRKITNYEKILEDFQRIYEEKKKKWKKEDEEEQKKKKENEKQNEEIVNYLLSLERRKNKSNF